MRKLFIVCLALATSVTAFAAEPPADQELVNVAEMEEVLDIEAHQQMQSEDDARDLRDWFRPVTCYAQNRRGRWFDATGFFPWVVQRRALEQCQRVSNRCREAGCYRR